MDGSPVRQSLPQPRLLTVQQVAAMLNLSEREVWRLRSAGKLPAAKLGTRTTRWKPVTVERFIESLRCS